MTKGRRSPPGNTPSNDAWNTLPEGAYGRREESTEERRSVKKYPLLSLVLANLIPVSGILLLDWNLFSVLFYYWLESAVVGAYNIPKMLMINPAPRAGAAVTSHKTSGIVFYLVHYSAFMAGHLFALYALFDPVPIPVTTVVMGIVPLGISHGISFVVNYVGRREYERVSISQQMVAPYRRIVVMHIAVILCGFLLGLLLPPQVVLAALILLKIAIDVAAHVWEHRRLGRTRPGRFRAKPQGSVSLPSWFRGASAFSTGTGRR